MSADFLLELLCEEIPARMQSAARNDLARLFAQELEAAGLKAEAIDVWSTPRRLALIARALPAQTEESREEVKGPRTSAPPQALEGFLRKTGLPHEQLEARDGVWFAVVERPGQATGDLLGPIVERIVRAFPWPKAMRWGSGELRWVRPLHGIVAILGEDIVPVEIDGIAGGAATVGHRFHHPGPITIGGPGDYAEKLRACHVIVDQDERERLIRDGAAKAAADAGLTLSPDEGLVVENAGLTEWPAPLLGRFDPDFLDVPREVIVLTMRTNQKYFACTDDAGALAPAFVCVANIDARDGGEAIVEGNRRVLAARLADARFFWEQDLKVPLERQAEKLSGIVFHEKLGTVADKVERVAKLARWLVEEGMVKGADPDQAERAARLAKADLVTGMVGEFPELQGVIGGYLARAQGEPAAIADAMRDHYKPVGSGDEVPTAPVTVAVALADKLDSLRSFFAIDEKPTGSKDPFALRRAALGVISLVVDNGLRLPIATGDLLDFFADRLKVQQREAGVRHDLIDAVFALGGEDDLVRLLSRVEALQAFVEGEDGADLLTAYKRAANILKKEKWVGPQVMSSREEQGIPQTGEEDPLVLVEEPGMREAVAEMASGHAGADLPQELALIAALEEVEPLATAAVEAEDFTGAMRALARLRGPIDAFFDHVAVNDPVPEKRERRLNLLLRFRDAVHRVADFSKIEG
ncbi:MAG TPA: glycine--tRNA ligase subunit beta [Sphingomicrobium sp.]|nr:glycine--tRNA ligase subunit beta [Sphingomicrobium sp.]